MKTMIAFVTSQSINDLTGIPIIERVSIIPKWYRGQNFFNLPQNNVEAQACEAHAIVGCNYFEITEPAKLVKF